MQQALRPAAVAPTSAAAAADSSSPITMSTDHYRPAAQLSWPPQQQQPQQPQQQQQQHYPSFPLPSTSPLQQQLQQLPCMQPQPHQQRPQWQQPLQQQPQQSQQQQWQQPLQHQVHVHQQMHSHQQPHAQQPTQPQQQKMVPQQQPMVPQQRQMVPQQQQTVPQQQQTVPQQQQTVPQQQQTVPQQQVQLRQQVRPFQQQIKAEEYAEGDDPISHPKAELRVPEAFPQSQVSIGSSSAAAVAGRQSHAEGSSPGLMRTAAPASLPPAPAAAATAPVASSQQRPQPQLLLSLQQQQQQRQQQVAPLQPQQQLLLSQQQQQQPLAPRQQQQPVPQQLQQGPQQQNQAAAVQQPYQCQQGQKLFLTQQQQQLQQQQPPVASREFEQFVPPPQVPYSSQSYGAMQQQQQRQQPYEAPLGVPSQQQPQQQQQEQLKQQHRVPSLMGVGTGSFPSSASVNGSRGFQDKGDQQQQQQQQETPPRGMPALQPLARPFNNRIDPAHVPRPEWAEQMTNVCGKRIETDKPGALPPSPAGFYTAVDKGCCSCRFMRSTLNQVPAFSHSLELSHLPFALVVTPFAAQPPTEAPVPLVDLRPQSQEALCNPYTYRNAAAATAAPAAAPTGDFYGGYFEVEDSEEEDNALQGSGSSTASTSAPVSSSSSSNKAAAQRAASSEGIVRCSSCMAYISPFMAWASNSTHCVCNLCGTSFALPEFYLSLLDQYRSGWRGAGGGGAAAAAAAEVDRHQGSQRLELWKGSVDFVAPKAFAAVSKLAQLQGKRKQHMRWLQRIQEEESRQRQLRQQHHQHSEEQQTQQSSWQNAQPAVFAPGDAGALAHNNSVSNLSTSSSSSSLKPCIVFVVDASASSINSGLGQAFAAGMQQVLHSVTLQVDVCIVLVSDKIYFIPNRGQETQRQQQQQQQQQQDLHLLVVGDIGDPFLPAPVENCFFKPEDRQQLLWVVSMLPTALNSCVNVSTTSAANAALKVAVDLVAERSAGGMVEMFYSTLPDIGVGALKHSNPSSHERLKSMEIQQQDFYNSIITACFTACACVDVFACPPLNMSLELQSLGFPAQQTGGDIRFVPEFCGTRDREWVAAEIRRIFTSCFYFDVEFKLRLSRGVSVDRILVSFSGARSLVDQGTFRLPRLSPHSTLLFQLKHKEQLETQKNVYAQSVCAYTPMHPSKKVPNRRLLRIHSLCLPLTFSLASVFRYAEVDATAFLIARSCAKMELHQEPEWREQSIKHLVEILSAYRANCASTSSEGQLILPDSLKLLPVYLQALFKHAAFRQSTVDPQVRLFHLLHFLRMSLTEFSTHLYPRLCLLHKSYIQPPSARERKALERIGEYSGIGDFVWMPISLPASGTNILSDGVYLCETGSCIMLYISQHVRREYIIDLFGFDAKLDERSVADLRLQNAEGSAGARILRVVEQIRFEKFDAPFIPLRIVVPKSSDETRLLTHLIEDPLSGDGSYVDFLCDLHKRVHARMEDN